MKRFCDEQFACLRSVCVSGVDQIHAELDRAAQDLERVFPVWRPTQNALPGDAHRAKTEPVYCEVATQFKSHIRGHSRCRCWLSSEDYIGFPGYKRGSSCETYPKKPPPRDALPVTSLRNFICHGRPRVRSRRRLSTQLSCFVSLLHQNRECLLKIAAKRHNASFVSRYHEELSSISQAISGVPYSAAFEVVGTRSRRVSHKLESWQWITARAEPSDL